jgi:hypothetical protein
MLDNVKVYTGWFKALAQYLRTLLGRSFGVQNVNIFSFRFATVSEWQLFYVDAILNYCDRLTQAPLWEFVEVQIVEVLLYVPGEQ